MAPSPDPRIPWYTPVGAVTVEKHTPDKSHQGKVLGCRPSPRRRYSPLLRRPRRQAHRRRLHRLFDPDHQRREVRPGHDGRDHLQRARSRRASGELGFKTVIHLGYRNHFLDEAAPTELRARLVFLIRALKIDTITTFSPWGHWEENPDHYVTGASRRSRSLGWPAWARITPSSWPVGCSHTRLGDLYYWAMRPGQPTTPSSILLIT